MKSHDEDDGLIMPLILTLEFLSESSQYLFCYYH